MRIHWIWPLLVIGVGCGASDDAVTGAGDATPRSIAPADAGTSSGCADVVAVEMIPETSGTFRFDVTVRSADTGWDKYADAWEVRAGDRVLARRDLLHPHEAEQPFTRSLGGVEIPADVAEISVLASDSVVGFCGRVETVAVPGPDAT